MAGEVAVREYPQSVSITVPHQTWLPCLNVPPMSACSQSWVEWLEDWLVLKFPERLRVNNGAVPGTLSSYM